MKEQKEPKEQKTLKKKHYILGHPLLWCVLAMPVIMIVYSVLKAVITIPLPADTGSSEVYTMFYQLVDCLCYMLTSYLLLKLAQRSYGKSFHTGLTTVNLKKSVILSLGMLIVMVLDVTNNLMDHNAHVVGMIPILSIILRGFTVGIAEELGLRSFVIENAMQTWKNKKYGVMATMWVSALGFGAMHLFNLTMPDENRTMIFIQVFYAAAIGVFFGAVYLRTRNLWGTILLHGLNDVESFYFLDASQAQEPTVRVVVMITIASAAMIALGMYMVRKSKLHEVEEIWGIQKTE